MPGVDLECEGPGATHHFACMCREEYFASLEAKLKGCDKSLERIASMCGMPDAGDACRTIQKFAVECRAKLREGT